MGDEKLSSIEPAVRIGQGEISRILDLKENLDHNGLCLDFVDRYQGLGWVVVAMEARGGVDPDLDFSQPRETWSPKLAELGMKDIQVNVGIRTGKASRLLVLEVNKGEGALSLDQLGEWRSECVAEVGTSREQHYYALPPERLAPPSFFLAPQVLIYGEGGLVLTPPSVEPQSREPWRWRCPPWETPPQPPKPAVWQFIRNHVPPADLSDGVEPQVLPWEELYRLIAPYGAVLKALLVPAASLEVYYSGVLSAAMGVGLTDPEVLLGLLWHAPHGDCRTHPGRWEYLQDLVAAAPKSPVGENGPADPHHVSDLPATLAALGAWSFPEKVWTAEGLAALGSLDAGVDPETALSSLDSSVSGQFFRLLAGLGEKVIVESCRYEALRSGKGFGPQELRRRLNEWDRRYSPSLAGSPETAPAMTEENRDCIGDIAQAWASVMPSQAMQEQQLQVIQAAAQDFLGQNPDLAGDRQKILMVIFCLKNYIAINPESAVLPFREKLDKAGKMARVFLWENREPLAAT
jgi:hypothetical protein